MFSITSQNIGKYIEFFLKQDDKVIYTSISPKICQLVQEDLEDGRINLHDLVYGEGVRTDTKRNRKK